jgi:hypothetical protein
MSFMYVDLEILVTPLSTYCKSVQDFVSHRKRDVTGASVGWVMKPAGTPRRLTV